MFRATRKISRLFSSLKQYKLKELFGETQPISDLSCLLMDRDLRKRKLNEIEENQKIKNYYQYEYFRGEDFIQNIPYSESDTYTIEDSIKEQKQKVRRTIEELAPIGNHLDRAALIRDRINAYHDKQRKYEIQEFERYLSQYPGTIRGPRPEDDQEAYKAYALKKMPRILYDELRESNFDLMEKEEQMAEEVQKEEENPPRIEAPSNYLSSLGSNRILLKKGETTKDEENAYFDQFNRGRSENQMLQMSASHEVPLMPSMNFENYQHFMNHSIAWTNFRNSFINHNMAANVELLRKRLQAYSQSFDDMQDEWMDIPTNIPSLVRYYKCLPKSIQDHPGMKDVYLGLQYSSPDFTYEQKEEALNWTAPLLLPYDDISTKIMTDYTSVSRVKPPIYIYQKLLTISPQYTWEIDKFLDQVHKEELRGQVTNQNKELKYPQPPELHKMWEEGAPSLPVDFYDNEDGFWDQIISQKLRRYDEHRPMLKNRPYFKH